MAQPEWLAPTMCTFRFHCGFAKCINWSERSLRNRTLPRELRLCSPGHCHQQRRYKRLLRQQLHGRAIALGDIHCDIAPSVVPRPTMWPSTFRLAKWDTVYHIKFWAPAKVLIIPPA